MKPISQGWFAAGALVVVGLMLIILHFIPMRPTAEARPFRRGGDGYTGNDAQESTKPRPKPQPKPVVTVDVGPPTVQPTVQPSVPAINMFDVEQDIVAYTNACRIAAGLYPLRVDAGAMTSARAHCAWMASGGGMNHGRLDGVSAENIAMGQATAYDVVNQSWMNSSGHRANMMSGGYTKIGVAAYRDSGGNVYWCQQFK
jgi:uncharacterized protein YkwD